MMSASTKSRQWVATLAVALLVLCSLVALSGVPEARADNGADFSVIVHPDNPATWVAKDFLADAFLKNTTRWEDGETIRPVDQKPDSAVRRRFSQDILRRSTAAVRSYWQQRIFSGRDVPPPEVDSDDAVIAYVLSHRGGVGYVSATAKTRESKVVTVK